MAPSQDIQIEALLIRACEPVIQTHCHVSAGYFHFSLILIVFFNKIIMYVTVE